MSRRCNPMALPGTTTTPPGGPRWVDAPLFWLSMLILNPTSDDAFRAFAEAARRPGDDPPSLQRRLRERYPKAVVRARALSGEPRDVWYVYRDGRWVSWAAPAAVSA